MTVGCFWSQSQGRLVGANHWGFGKASHMFCLVSVPKGDKSVKILVRLIPSLQKTAPDTYGEG